MKKILVCDDHPAMRNGVKMILSREFGEIEFGEASSAAEVMKKLHEKKWDILICDMGMPGRSGLDVLKQMQDENIKMPVLIFSMHPEEQIAVRCLKAGASGYVSKNAADAELVTAVTFALSGKKYITPSLADLIVSQFQNPDNKAPHELLSDREYQTFILIAKGKSISEVAEQLSLAVPTISTFRARILEKMNLKNNAEIANYAIRNNLVQ
jgi:DNA-binding NarL/FixJ family response regulator